MRHLSWFLLIVPLLFELTACSEPGVEQEVIKAPSGYDYYRLYISYEEAEVTTTAPSDLVILDLPFELFDTETTLPLATLVADGMRLDFRPEGENEIHFPILVKDGLAQIDNDPYVEFRTALIINEGADAELIFTEKGASLRQFAEDLVILGVEDAVLLPSCRENGRYFYAGAYFEVPIAAKAAQCSGRIVLK